MTIDKENIKLVVCDIDGTILPGGKDAMSRRTADALNKVKASGREVLICTGRHYTLLPKSFFEDLDMELIGTINGACLVRRDGSVIEKHPMSKENMDAITDLCVKYGLGLGFKFEDKVVTYANYEKFMHGYAKAETDWDIIINNDEKKDHHLTYGLPLGTFIIGDESIIDPFAESIPDLIFAWSYRNGYDVFLKDINKTTAVSRVLKDKNLTWDNVIAFGDAGNDLAMIKKAGVGVALGNAKDGVRSEADIVADTCENDGVAKVLEELGLCE